MSTASSTPPVVTIWEEYGSGADAIGRAVAKQLGLPYHAQAFSSEDIEAGEVPQGPSSEAEHAPSRMLLSQVLSAMGGAFGGSDGTDFLAVSESQHDLVAQNNQTVGGYAKEGGVIVGRNATVILADRPNTLHVLLTGDEESRTAHAAEVAGISLEEARKRRKREDKVRTDMSTSLYGWDPREPKHYHLMLTTSRLSHEAAVATLVHAITAAVNA